MDNSGQLKRNEKDLQVYGAGLLLVVFLKFL
jgi:hypothetical protein